MEEVSSFSFSQCALATWQELVFITPIDFLSPPLESKNPDKPELNSLSPHIPPLAWQNEYLTLVRCSNTAFGSKAAILNGIP